MPAPTASKTVADLRAQNLVNPEDALKYVPNLTIRKRYIGDRNALIGGRSSSTLQAPRGLVLMDGYLLSNFLGRFDAPRWNMIAPEEIERVDVLYGPFAAIYPGNSIGTTVAVRTRRVWVAWIDKRDQTGRNIAARLAQLGIDSDAYAFGEAPREALQFAVDATWLGEKPRAYRYGVDGKRRAITGVVEASDVIASE